MPHYRVSTDAGTCAAPGAADRRTVRWAEVGLRAGVVLFAALLNGASAQFSVVVPGTAVPSTLQPLTVLLAGAVLGARYGAASQVAYLGLGAAGVSMFAVSPVLAPGLARLIGPTGGFLLAFPLAAFVTGWFADRGWTRTTPGAVAAMTAGLVMLYAGGASWLAALAGPSSAAALWPLAAADLVKVVAGAAVLPLASRVFGPRA
jgi:biotin transport system substrate-specific component